MLEQPEHWVEPEAGFQYLADTISVVGTHQTEKLAAPSEMRKQRKLIARCQTVLGERSREAVVSGEAAGAESDSTSKVGSK